MYCAPATAEALARLVRDRPDLLLTDERMPYLPGVALVAHVRREPGAAVPAILVSAAAPPALPPDTPFLPKPLDLDRLLAAVAGALAAAPARRW